MKVNKENLKFITGIKGYAALAVFLIHSGGGGLRGIDPVISNLVDMGKYGVVVFFVLSAITITLSLNNIKQFNFLDYLLKRVIRILPMYLVALLIGCFIQQLSPIQAFKELFFHLSFINLIFLDYRNSVLQVSWTLPIEFFMYFLIPVMIYYVKKKSANILNLLLISISLFILSTSATILPYINNTLPDGLVLGYSLERYALLYTISIIFTMLLLNGKTKIIYTNWVNLAFLISTLLIFCIVVGDNGVFANLFFTI